MSKKEKARQHILKLKDGYEFTMKKMAIQAGVDAKSVSNAISPAIHSGAISVYQVEGQREKVYKIESANKVALSFVSQQTAKPTPKKRRSAAVIEIDRKIADYQSKIAQLKEMRKEFK